MRQMLRRVTLAAALACTSAGPAYATTQSTDQSDLWWNPNESGWGMQLVHRGEVIFATMFVYDAARRPVWYTATLRDPGASDEFDWAGDVYATTGPYFGAASFDPSSLTINKVGTMEWTSTSVETGRLTYTIDNVTKTKELTRQTLVLEDLSGEYMGAVHTQTSGCAAGQGGPNGDAFRFANLTAVQRGSDLTLTIAPQGGNACTFKGTSTQYGQFAWSKGTYTCASGDQGTMEVYEARVAWSDMSGRWTAKSTNFGCLVSGAYSGVWVNQAAGTSAVKRGTQH